MATRRSPRAARCLALILLACPCHASAQASEDAVAVELYQRAADLYRHGRYAEAAVLLREAYRKRPDPVLQYNLGRACEEMGDLGCAVQAYEKYLGSASPADRKAVERRLAGCRARSGVQRGTRSERPSAPGLLPPLTVGVGLACTGAGLVLAAMARSRHEDAASDPVQRTAAERQSSAESMMKAANVTLAGGVVVSVAAAIWWVVEAASGRRSASGGTPVAVEIGPRSARVSVAF